MITSRDVRSACFKGSRMSGDVIIAGYFQVVLQGVAFTAVQALRLKKAHFAARTGARRTTKRSKTAPPLGRKIASRDGCALLITFIVRHPGCPIMMGCNLGEAAILGPATLQKCVGDFGLYTPKLGNNLHSKRRDLKSEKSTL